MKEDYSNQLEELRYLVKKLISMRLGKKFVDELNKKTGKQWPHNFATRIKSGRILFQRDLSQYLGYALEIARGLMKKYEKQYPVDLSDQEVHWVLMSRAQVKEFMTEETRDFLYRFNLFFKKQEINNIHNFFSRYEHRATEITDIKTILGESAEYSFNNIKELQNWSIEPGILHEIEKLTIAFPAGHTATAVLFFYISHFKKVNWSLNYQFTHSVYLQRQMIAKTFIPEIAVIADTLAIELVNNSAYFKKFHALGYLWHNRIVALTSAHTPMNRQYPLKGDFYMNLSNNSGAEFAFSSYQRRGFINKTIKGKHNSYEKSLGKILEKNNFNYVVTNDSQSQLYMLINDLRGNIRQIDGFSFPTENIILYNDNYFSSYDFTRKQKILLTIKSIILNAIDDLRRINFWDIEKIIELIMHNEEFLQGYLKAKNIKIITPVLT